MRIFSSVLFLAAPALVVAGHGGGHHGDGHHGGGHHGGHDDNGHHGGHGDGGHHGGHGDGDCHRDGVQNKQRGYVIFMLFIFH